MKKSFEIKPVADCQAFMMISVEGTTPSNKAIELIRNPLVMGLMLREDNVYDAQQLSRFIKACRQHRNTLVMMIDIEQLMNITILTLKKHDKAFVEKYLKGISRQDLIHANIDALALVKGMVSFCKKHQVIPHISGLLYESKYQANSVFSSIGGGKDNLVHRLFIDKYQNEVGCHLVLDHDSQAALSMQANTWSIQANTCWQEEKEGNKGLDKLIKVSYQDIDDFDESIVDARVTLSNSPICMYGVAVKKPVSENIPQYANRIGILSNFVDLIHIPAFDESIWYDMIKLLVSNPRLEVEEKLASVLPEAILPVYSSRQFCCLP